MVRLGVPLFSDGGLINPEYTTGDMKSIGFIADKIGLVSVFVISIVGFCIIMFSTMKNALHALYFTFSRFWDKVDQAKRTRFQYGGVSEGFDNQMAKGINTVGQFILCLFPNIKMLLDEDTDHMTAKAYWMKSLPMLVFAVFMGSFIFLGYPIRTAEKITKGANEVYDILLANIDPIALAEAVPEKFAKPKYSTEGSKQPFDIVVNKATKSAYTAYVGTANDIKADQRKQFGLDLENWIIDQLQMHNADLTGGKYSIAYSARVEQDEPDLTRVHGKSTPDGSTKTLAWSIPMVDFETGTAIDLLGKYLRVDLVLTKKSANLMSTSIEVSMSTTFTYSAKEIVITLPEPTTDYRMEAISSARCSVGGITGKITINGSKLSIKPDGKTKFPTETVTTITEVQGLSYRYGKTYSMIREIKNESGKPTFMPLSTTAGIPVYDYGQEPKPENGDPNAKAGEDTPAGQNAGETFG